MITPSIAASRVGVAGFALAVFAFTAAAAAAHRVEKHFPTQSKPVITVQNSSGRIEVKAWNKNEVQVLGNHASDKVEIDTEQAGNRIEVVTHVLDSKATSDELKADLQISVPEESELRIRTDSGEVTVASVHGDMTFDTVGANLELSDVEGSMVIKTIDGSLVCLRCAGKLDANSISGSMKLLQPSLDRVTLQTSSGDILFDGNFLRRGIYIMKNYTGSIEVHFAPTDSFDLRANSLKGQVYNEASLKQDPHGKVPQSRYGSSFIGTVNDGFAKVELSSFSGTIKILKRE